MPEQNNFEQEINIQELLRLLWGRKYLIIAVTAASLALALLFRYSATPEFRSTAVVMIKDSNGSEGDVLAPMLSVMPSAFIDPMKNDIELMSSLPIAEKAVEQLYRSPMRDSLELFGKHPYISPIDRLLAFAGLQGFLEKDAEEVPVSQKEIMRNFAENLKGRITIDNPKETNVLHVSVSSPFSEEAAKLANALCRAYQQKDIEWNSEQAKSVNQFVEEQLGEQQKKVATVENNLSGYMEKQDIYELTGNAQQLLQKLIDIDARYNEIMAERNILAKRLDFIRKKLSGEEKALSANIAESVGSQLRAVQNRIKAEEADYMALLQQKGAASPEVKARRQQIDQMKSQLDQVVRGKIAGELAYAGRAQKFQFDLISEQLQTDLRLAELNYSAQEFGKLKNYYESQLNALPDKQLNYARLQRDREVVNSTYTFLKQKFEESRIKIASEVGRVVIVGLAYPPKLRESPDTKKILLVGLVLGLGLGGALVFVLEMRDHSVKEEQFFDDHGFVTLARIPFVDKAEFTLADGMKKAVGQLLVTIDPGKGNGKSNGNGRHPGQGSADGTPLLITDKLSSPFSESFRDLRTNLTFARAGTPLRSVLVTGTAVSEGKSTICANLGLAFALTGKRVLIVDCDLRRPSQHKLLGSSKAPGLSNYLAGQEPDMSKLIQPTLNENLFLLPAGAAVPNPNELIGSQMMSETVELLESRYDMVIIDSPPLLLISDAALLSQSVDGILLAARLEYTNKKLLQDVQKISYIRPQLLGVALIGSSSRDRYGYDRYGYKGQYKYKTYSHYVDTPES